MNPSEEHPLNALTEQASDEERKKQIGAQKALRTFEGDIQDAIRERNASAASMVMAQQVQDSSLSSNPPPVKRHLSPNFYKKLFIILGSIILVLIGLGGGYYLYTQSSLALPTVVAPKPVVIASIVPPDGQKILDMTGQSQSAAMSAIEKALQGTGGASGSIQQVIPVQKNDTGVESIMSAEDFMSVAALPAPDILLRSLADKWMLGTYDDNGTPAPFMILTDNFFQNAYAGMIDWEQTMPDDFVAMFGYAGRAAQPQASSSIASYFNIKGSFKDGILENKDVRTFYKTDGTILILYSFVDNNTIVITTDEKALAEIINRLEKQTFIR